MCMTLKEQDVALPEYFRKKDFITEFNLFALWQKFPLAL